MEVVKNAFCCISFYFSLLDINKKTNHDTNSDIIFEHYNHN